MGIPTLYATALPLGKSPSTYWIVVWVGFRAGLSAEKDQSCTKNESPVKQPVAYSHYID